jgi:proline iminopeptidase
MWQREFVETSRGKFELFTQGEGLPLCNTHLYSEFNELGNSFPDILVGNFKVYLVNLKDAGNSSKTIIDDELSMVETSKDLEAIRIALGLEKWAFAGHSTGGMLGLVYATLFPHSLTKLLIGGATASKNYMEHEGSMYSSKSPLNKRLKEIFAILKSSKLSREERIKASREWTGMSLYRPEKYTEYFSKPSSGKVVQKRLDYYSFVDLPHFDIKDELEKILTPTFVYCGKHDTQCPLFFSKEIHASLSNSELYIFNESNHFPFVEEKVLFKEMVKEFAEI